MTMNQIIEKARILGVKNYSRLRKADLIRAIQKKKGTPLVTRPFPAARNKIACGSRVALVKQSNNPQSLEAPATSP